MDSGVAAGGTLSHPRRGNDGSAVDLPPRGFTFVGLLFYFRARARDKNQRNRTHLFMAQEDDNSKKPAPRTDFRILLMWGAIIAVLAGLLIYTPGGKVPSREITMAQVLEFAKQKNISELTLKNNPVGGAKNYYTITGELRSSPTNGTELPPNNAQAPAYRWSVR